MCYSEPSCSLPALFRTVDAKSQNPPRSRSALAQICAILSLRLSPAQPMGKAMRAQEACFPKTKRETQTQFLARLRTTALGLPRGEVAKAARDMRRRVCLVLAGNGRLFTE